MARKAAFLSDNLARHAAELPAADTDKKALSVEEIQRRNELAKATRKSEAAEYLAKARRAEDEGKLGVAKVYYQMAARRADGDLRDQIAARLAILEGAKNATKLADR